MVSFPNYKAPGPARYNGRGRMSAADQRAERQSGPPGVQATSMLLISRSPPGTRMAACWANCLV